MKHFSKYASLEEARDKMYDALDPDQEEVVRHDGGDCLVLAAAGSGKTRCIQHRVAHLLYEGAHPRRVAAISFTKKASTELEKRVSIMHPSAKKVITRTFHSLCYMILRKEGLATNVLQGGSAARIIVQSFRDVSWSSEEPPSYVLGLINKAKMRATPRDSIPNALIEMDPHNGPKIVELYKIYEAEKKKRGAIDFADMLYLVWEEMAYGDGGVRERCQTQFQHVIVDEVQDLNPLQLKIADMWSRDDCSLMMVGDIRQSIYGWRGANMEKLLELADDREMERLHLTRNYRSSYEIVDRSNILISQGEIESQLPDCDPVRKEEAGLIESYMVPDPKAEGDFIADKIKGKLDDGYEPKDFACLYRVNAQAQFLEISLSEAGIPYEIIGGTSFFERKEIMDVMAYLKLIVDPTDKDALSRVYNVPTRYLGRAFWNKFKSLHKDGAPVMDALSEVARSDYRNGHNVRSLGEDLRFIMKIGEDGSPMEALTTVFNLTSKVGEKRSFLDLYKADDGGDSRRSENLEALRDLSRKYDTVKEFVESIERQETPEEYEDKEGRVQLMTVHRSKGLEFDTVFVAGFSDGLFPHAMGDQDEERRIAYVAITRAENHLVVTSPAFQFGKSKATSPYLGVIGLNTMIRGDNDDESDDEFAGDAGGEPSPELRESTPSDP